MKKLCGEMDPTYRVDGIINQIQYREILKNQMFSFFVKICLNDDCFYTITTPSIHLKALKMIIKQKS